MKLTKRILPVLVLAILLAACATVDYVGNTYPPTTQVDVYASQQNIKQDYTVMGKMILDFEDGTSNDTIHQRILSEAEKRGADAVLLLNMKKVQSGAMTTWEGMGPDYWGWWEMPPYAYGSGIGMTTYEQDLEVSVNLLKYNSPAGAVQSAS